MTSIDSSPSGTPDPLPDCELATLRAGLVLLARLHLRDADIAEDIAQEAMSRTLEAYLAGRVRDRTRPGAFARGVARHLIADAHRARRRVVAGEAEVSIESVPAEGAGTLDEIVVEEDRARVRAALDCMPESDRELLALLYVDGLRPEEIARRLHEPAQRIRKRKERALRRLRALIEGDQSRAPRAND